MIFLGFAQQIHAESDVKLITIGPGSAFWSAFGHTALAVDNRVFGFGYFSFEDEGLIKSFIDNKMFYDIGISNYQDELLYAKWQNRTFIVQDLNFTAQQKQQLLDFLNWHNLPENQSYRYDYFINNCATKIRDIIDEIWQGLVQGSFSQTSNESYFSQTFPAKNQALMNFGIVLGYGWPAYKKRTAWELMAFPVYFQNKISELSNNKVSTAKTVYKAEPEPVISSWVKTHWFLWVYVLILLMALKSQITRHYALVFISYTQFILGLLILYFWLFSGHTITHWNFNVLLFTPLVFCLQLSHRFKWLILSSYLCWALTALILSAWYFLPICMLHIYWLLLKTRANGH